MAKATSSVVIKKKKWVPIVAPKLFNEQVLGESFVAEADELKGRSAKVSLMVLTGDPQKQTVTVGFKVTGVDNGRAVTEFVSYRLLPAAARKLMRRRRSKIDDSFVIETQDKKVLRIKPMIVTRTRAQGALLASLRALERAYLAKIISQLDFESFVREVVQKKLQQGLGQALRKLCPIGVCEIRQFELIAPEKVKELGIRILLPPAKLPDLTSRRKREMEAERVQSEGSEEFGEERKAAEAQESEDFGEEAGTEDFGEEPEAKSE
ncbi:MAG: hypothetical protein C4541_11535 [Candidatus Auribacter fodinae]|uniref:30S ribosomal protein S3ae n=1 Tax=Candidatus Auribacter fodinae TaxID=2093366 RepID=A0A3A4QXA9_9BACT|nr:MAG: hypothetical protein C4541_11535 [Candidatus Auribacter fodinae]